MWLVGEFTHCVMRCIVHCHDRINERCGHMAAAVNRERSKFQTPPTYRTTMISIKKTMRILRSTCSCSSLFSLTGRRLSLSVQSSSTIKVKNDWSLTFALAYAFMIYRGINLNCPFLSSLDLRLFQQ